MKQLTTLFLLVCTSWHTHGMTIAPSMEFDYNASLVANDIYNIFWTVSDEEITVEVHAKTLGYVGFGLSPNGGMKGADIVMGWVKDGTVYFQDRHSTRNAEPTIDVSQDWKLLAGREEGEYTILKFSRALTNCDEDDLDITDGTVRVIYSYHEDDPVESTGLPYHGKDHRGTKSMTFISHVETEALELPSNAISMDFRVNNVQVPAVDTTYYCQAFKIPPLAAKHHVIQVEPLIQAGNEGLVHHMILYACPNDIDADANDGMQEDCEHERMEEILEKCYTSLFIYAIGTEYTHLPLETGIPLGGTDGLKMLRLEIHYDNPPPSQSGLVDSSGMRLHMTPTLRKYDSWMLTVGLGVNEWHVIPPNFDRLTNNGYCPSSCLSAGMKASEDTSEGIKVYGMALHSHLLGVDIKLRHFRNGEELAPIAEDDHFDFNYQYMKILKNPVTVKPGDDLLTQCTYNSKNRENVTYGGASTRSEMCLIFVLYYPRLSSLNRCLSMMFPVGFMQYTGAEISQNGRPDNVVLEGEEYVGKKWWDIVSSSNWNDAAMREKFQDTLAKDSIEHYQLCDAMENGGVYKKPFAMTELYVKDDKCSGAIKITSFLAPLLISLLLSTS